MIEVKLQYNEKRKVRRAYCISELMMAVAVPFEMSVHIYQSTRRQVSEDNNYVVCLR
jgi:hypothetical protein